MLDLAHMFHTGYVVPDIGDATREFARHFDIEFTPIHEMELRLRGPEGRMSATVRLAFSTGGSNRIELLEPVAGTVWQAPVHALVGSTSSHHLAVWSSDIIGDSGQLERDGAELLLTIDGPKRVHNFAYHRMSNGTILELVDARARPAYEQWFAGGSFPGSSR